MRGRVTGIKLELVSFRIKSLLFLFECSKLINQFPLFDFVLMLVLTFLGIWGKILYWITILQNVQDNIMEKKKKKKPYMYIRFNLEVK